MTNLDRTESRAAGRTIAVPLALILLTVGAALLLSWAGDAMTAWAGIDGRLIVGVVLAGVGVLLAGGVQRGRA